MKEILRNVSQKGQVTIPIEVRNLLGIELRGKVAFEIAEGEVRVKAAESVVDATFQKIPALKQKLAWDEVLEIAHDDAAREAAEVGR